MTTIFTAWQGVQSRIGIAATACARQPDAITLLAVSKTFPASAVRELYEFGQRHFGENYVQELQEKAAALSDCPDLVWHFIGPLQSNKTRIVAETADWVHSVDRLKIAERLSQQRPEHLAPLQVCLQVNVSGEQSKSGVRPAEAPALARAISRLPNLQLRGMMCIPDPDAGQEALSQQFALLRQLQEQLRATDALPLDTLSMGMSGDLELAIREGSTMVRIGTAIFGARTAKG
ncbi:YggS family pyridoxal phosphate-dependent enzyme [Chitinilyticum piscinae]|uniref:Pyridoxal phosphate homeostasis protein n=1 Tax=Chitinilyticum piscinae TaxID=2866724 RepID=A0A8J7FL90_9NEIS|nr:YggS family pyridoxal phosphate-dependent enzyme [Chitinilyticum piscinae]MBE9609897.1 YggS family pyridoxal phosphate-dependent enzyme [Chitinilyticum piscinae]